MALSIAVSIFLVSFLTISRSPSLGHSEWQSSRWPGRHLGRSRTISIHGFLCAYETFLSFFCAGGFRYAQCPGAAKHKHAAESMRVGCEVMLALEKQRKISRRHDEDSLPPSGMNRIRLDTRRRDGGVGLVG